LVSNVRKKLLIIGFLLVTILFSYISLCLLMCMGPAASFFVIKNHDMESHEVTVEVFDKNNNSVINETHTLERKSDLVKRRPFGVRLRGGNVEYTFKVTMDKQITNTTKVEIPDRKTTVVIYLYAELGKTVLYKSESGETIPILIETRQSM